MYILCGDVSHPQRAAYPTAYQHLLLLTAVVALVRMFSTVVTHLWLGSCNYR